MFFDKGESPLERHLNPSIYEKIERTEALLKEGVEKKDLESKGALDFETYRALQDRWNDQEKRIKEYKQEIIVNYGSLQNAPSSVYPCKKHDSIKGNKNVLVLLTEFKDKKHSHESSEFKELLFSKDSKHSMRNYYLEASWNQLDINGDVNDTWYTLTGNRSEYVDKSFVNGHYPNAQKLVRETILSAKKDNKFDFSSYSKDGKIEILIIVYAGSGLDTKLNIKFIRPHQDRLLEPIEVQKGIWAEKYCIVSELPADDLGVFCHEVGHFLGLPDLYKEGYSPIVGSWCLMGIGDHINEGKTPSHPCAWCKLHLGWTEPISLNQSPQIHDIPAVIDDKTIYKLDVKGSGGKEYFLLENRQQIGFDENLPSSGLLIWHVDENACLGRVPNFDPKNYFITLKQSDGKEDLQKNITEMLKKAKIGDEPPKSLEGDEGDPFPGVKLNRVFNDESSPNSRSYKGEKSHVEVMSISDSDKLMKAEIGTKIGNNRTQIQYQPDSPKYLENVQYNFVNPFFLNYLFFDHEEKSSFEDVITDLKYDFLDLLLDDKDLNFYKMGYQTGFKDGYKKASKFDK